VRLAESSMTAVAYLYAGLYSVQSFQLIPLMLPSILIGVPIGAFIIHHVRPETFRRVCMSFDAWVVAFGISTLLRLLDIVPGRSAYLVLAGVIVIDAVMMYRFFSRETPVTAAVSPDVGAGGPGATRASEPAETRVIQESGSSPP
jgi:hypothetical protein